jgi:hypothetical protein
VAEQNGTAPGGLYRKLAEVMAEVGYVQKQGYNSFHKYKYVTEADLIEAVRQKLAERNVVLIPSVVDVGERPVTSDKGKQSTVTTVKVAFTFCDGDTGELHRAEWAGAGDDPADKGLYKAYTGALKYFLMKAFLIATGDDPEGDDGTDRRSAGGPAPSQKAGQITPEQYQAIVAAFQNAESLQPTDLNAWLDQHGAASGADVAQRVAALDSPTAFQLQKWLGEQAKAATA